MIRPAKCHFNGFIKPFIKGADKNHNPRKGTETPSFFNSVMYRSWLYKNHNPRKGTEAWEWPEKLDQMAPDKNHNPRKGTGKKKAAQSSQCPLLGKC